MNRASGLKDTDIPRLSDGRQLAYAEYGDPNGEPGNPNSRLLYGLMPGSPFQPGLHRIAPDRPGYGLSDFYPRGRTAADYPDDVVALADSLELDRFAAFSASGGGPSALACAWKILQRLMC